MNNVLENSILLNSEDLKKVEECNLYRTFTDIMNDNDGEIPVIDLNPNLFKGNNEVLEKYFRYDNHDLEIFHIPELTDEEYNKFVKNNKVKGESNQVLETATAYYKKKAQLYIISEDLGIPRDKLSLEGYNSNELYYAYSDFHASSRYAEDEAYRESEDDMPTSKELYIDMNGHKNSLDYELYDELNSICLKLIKKRLAMLLDVKKICFILKDILEYTNGFAENINADQVRALQGAKRKLTDMLSNKELVEWINAGNNDYTLYAECEETRKDYIKEYHDMISVWTGRGAEEYFKDVIHCENDKYEDLFFVEDIEDMCVSYIENRDSEGDENEEEYCYA